MFKMLGFGDLNTLEVWTVALSGIALVMIVGWLVDMIAGRIGFGVFGNAIISLFGLVVALVLFRTYVGEVSLTRLPTVMGAATASIVFHIFTLIFLRRALRL
jgi:hypothetical protein